MFKSHAQQLVEENDQLQAALANKKAEMTQAKGVDESSGFWEVSDAKSQLY